MKKIVLAAALLAVSMGASAQVAVSGKIMEFVDRTKTGSVATSSLYADPTSNIAVTATEDLGGGLKARAVVETRIFASDSAATSNYTRLGDRQSTVGIASKMGSVDLGRNIHSVFGTVASTDVFGAMYGSVASDVHNLRNLRVSNATFLTLNPMQNVSVSYEKANATTDLTQSSSVSYGVTGSLAGVTGSYSRYESGIEKTNMFGLGMKVMSTQVALLHSEDTGTAGKINGTSVGVAQPIAGTPFTVKGSYGTKTGNTKAYAVGVDYNLSKRTQLGVAYRNVNATGTANDVAQVGVGITHSF
jgi:hypothetical protein